MFNPAAPCRPALAGDYRADRRRGCRLFAKPPPEYSAIHWAIWGGPQSKERIISDIDKIAANGGGVYMINNSRGVQPKYLSPEYMDIGEGRHPGMQKKRHESLD